MQLIVLGSDTAFEEAGLSDKEGVIRVSSTEKFFDHPEADAYLNLEAESLLHNYEGLKCVFANSVVQTIPEGAVHLYRFNGWPGFLGNELWEVSGADEALAQKVLGAIGKKAAMVKNEPGFISPRVIAMIINEAGMTADENIASRVDIDTAMKLGTGYPFGPFEWMQKIGPDNVYQLLQKLAATDERYTPGIFFKTALQAS